MTLSVLCLDLERSYFFSPPCSKGVQNDCVQMILLLVLKHLKRFHFHENNITIVHA